MHYSRYVVFFFLFGWMIMHSSCKTEKHVIKEKNIAALNGLNIHFNVKGNGPPMIVGHLNSGAVAYENSLQDLEQRFTMVYYNPRGTGQSETPTSIQQYGYKYLVKEVESLRKYLGYEKVWLFGHSDQSSVFLKYALEYPSRVEGLILSGTHFIMPDKDEARLKKEFLDDRRRDAWFKKIEADRNYSIDYKTNRNKDGEDISYASVKWWCYNEASSKKVIPLYELTNKAGRRKAINKEQPFTSEKDRQKLFDQIRKDQEKYDRIKIPVFILHGKYDTNNPFQLAYRLKNAIPNSTIYMVDKAGHFPWVEAKEESFKVINNWLDSL